MRAVMNSQLKDVLDSTAPELPDLDLPSVELGSRYGQLQESRAATTLTIDQIQSLAQAAYVSELVDVYSPEPIPLEKSFRFGYMMSFVQLEQPEKEGVTA